jgi:hypothetical protein
MKEKTMSQVNKLPGQFAGSAASSESSGELRPWWKEPYVWMVISGPLSAVIACIITAVYILQGPDALVSDDQFDQGRIISRELKTAPSAMQPAHTARNHSATGVNSNAKP